MIVLDHVGKAFGETGVLSDISFIVPPGELVCITGPSGAGKSTLIHMLIGAEKPSDGTIEIDGLALQKVKKNALQLYRRRVGMIFQDYKLLWNRTVRENIAFPLEVVGASEGVIEKRVDEVLSLIGLRRQADVLTHMLSGGEKARTAIARAIVHKPMIILADEPTGNLDPKESIEIMKLFQQIHSEGTTIILATHDAYVVDALNCRVIRIESGRVVRDSVGTFAEQQKALEESKEDPVSLSPSASLGTSSDEDTGSDEVESAEEKKDEKDQKEAKEAEEAKESEEPVSLSPSASLGTGSDEDESSNEEDIPVIEKGDTDETKEK